MIFQEVIRDPAGAVSVAHHSAFQNAKELQGIILLDHPANIGSDERLNRPYCNIRGAFPQFIADTIMAIFDHLLPDTLITLGKFKIL